MPVLAKQTVKRTTLKKNSQILKSDFSSATIGEFGITGSGAGGADPIGNAIGGQRIMVP
jgi:hypothetical protein